MTSLSVAKWATYALLALSAVGTGVGASRLSAHAGASIEWPVVGYLAPAPSRHSGTSRSVVAMVAGHEVRRACGDRGDCLVWLLDARHEVLDSRVVPASEPVELRMSPDGRTAVLEVVGERSWSIVSVPRPVAREEHWSGSALLAALCALAALALQLRNGLRAAGLRAFLERARPCTVDSRGHIHFEDGLFPRIATTKRRVRPGPASVLDGPLPTLLGYRSHGVPEVAEIRRGEPAEQLRRLERDASSRTTALALGVLALVAPVAMLLG